MKNFKTLKEFMNEDNTLEEPTEEKIFYPDGVYISVNLSEESKLAFEKYFEKYLSQVETPDLDELHCTLIYSNKPHEEEIIPDSYKAIGTFKNFSIFGMEDKYLVAEFISQELTERNKELTEKYDFISDFEEYKPHITISTPLKTDIDINSLPEIDFQVTFIEETVSPLDTDYKNSKESEEESDTLVGKELSKMNKKEKDEEN